METSIVPGAGASAHSAGNLAYTAPASQALAVAPAAHTVYLAPAGEVYIAPASHTSPVETSSGIGINVDHGS